MDVDAPSSALVDEIRESYENTAIPSLKLNICKQGTVRSSLLAYNRSLRARQGPWSDSIAVHPASRIPTELLRDDDRRKAASRHFEQDQQVYMVALKPFVESRVPFVKRTYSLFAKLQHPTKARAAGNSDSISHLMDIDDNDEDEPEGGGGTDHMVAISQVYRAELRYKAHDRDTDVSERSLFQSMHAVWELCEIIYLAPPGMPHAATPVAVQLQSWLNTTRRGAAPQTVTALNDTPAELLAQDARFWPDANTNNVKGPVHRLRQVLKQLSSPMTVADVDDRFIKIRDICSSVLSVHGLENIGTRAQDVDGFRVLFQILNGDERVILETAGDWREAFVALAMYSRPSIQAAELVELLGPLQSSRKDGSSNASMDLSNPVDAAMVSFIRGDMMAARRHCSKIDWWLVTHLFDVLDRYGRALVRSSGISRYHSMGSPGSINYQQSTLSSLWEADRFAHVSQRQDMREWTILNYAETLLPHPILYLVGVEYLSYCPNIGKAYMIETLLRHPPPSDGDSNNGRPTIHDLFEVCKKHGLDAVHKELHRVIAQRELSRGRLIPALTHYAQAGASSRATVVVYRTLQDYFIAGTKLPDGIVSIPSSSAGTGRRIDIIPAIQFFNSYQHVRESYRHGEYKKAAATLVLLMSSGAAPARFWGMMLLDALPMLEGPEDVVFGVDDTYELMRCLEYVCVLHWNTGAEDVLDENGMTTVDGGNMHKRKELSLSSSDVDVMRAALARNLARAMVVELERQW
ncbi:hypothetical protein SeLEV6574_g00882 [Synchytrium endobioticum]|uniref:Nuclear pore complex protein Nup85 n=1 Tax=Synchytrium endobioticum TaxID=286115 RepID=A0A507DGN4_9FUNG|nr:hypothetical protein SeLEV6574_g00882 [Synchytrium endobioticum]